MHSKLLVRYLADFQSSTKAWTAYKATLWVHGNFLYHSSNHSLVRIVLTVADCSFVQASCDQVADTSPDEPASQDAGDHLGQQDGRLQTYGRFGEWQP